MSNAAPELICATPMQSSFWSVRDHSSTLDMLCIQGASSLLRFTTSSMIQEASRKLGFPPKLTMSLAGSLHGNGLITYHRTDSIGIDSSKLPDIHQKIIAFYGEKYLEKRVFKNNRNKKNCNLWR